MTGRKSSAVDPIPEANCCPLLVIAANFIDPIEWAGIDKSRDFVPANVEFWVFAGFRSW